MGVQDAQYVPGDVLTLLPNQNPVSINRFLKRCGLDGDTFITVEASDSDVCSTSRGEQKGDVSKKTAVPIRTLVEALMDVDSASPRRYLFEVMSHFAKAQHERERLQYFATPEGRDDLYRYNQRERRTVLEILEDFPSVQVMSCCRDIQQVGQFWCDTRGALDGVPRFMNIGTNLKEF
jgi:sulfite reductase alpha subunit-like flavoprotein